MGGRVEIASRALRVELLTAGASVRAVYLEGVAHSLVLGAEDVGVYGAANRSFFGATVGRCANRIAGGRMAIDGRAHRLGVNEPPNQLHGGAGGFFARDWTLEAAGATGAVMRLESPDGEEGYPGAVRVTATFEARDDGTLSILYEGAADAATVLNLTSHLYVNLHGAGPTRDHRLRLGADAYLPVDAMLIPTGAVAPVAGTPFDFRAARRLGDGPAVLDHNFCLDGGRTAEARPVLRIETDAVRLDVSTTECGMQIYDGAKFDGSVAGLDGAVIGRHGGIAVEPQFWPNAVNEPAFLSPVIRPGERYRHHSLYRFARV